MSLAIGICLAVGGSGSPVDGAVITSSAPLPSVSISGGISLAATLLSATPLPSVDIESSIIVAGTISSAAILPTVSILEYPVPNATSLSLWLSPRLGVTTVSGAVSAWTDQSGSGNNFQQTVAGNRPTFNPAGTIGNNQPTFSLLGSSSQKLQSTANFQPTQAFTVYIVAKLSSTSGNPGLFDWSGTRAFAYAGANWTFFAGTTQASATAPNTSAHVFAAVFNGASSNLYMDSSATPIAANKNAGANNPTGSMIVGTQSSGFMTGEMGDVAVYAAAHGTTDVAKFFRFAGGLYGQSWS